MLKRNAHEIPKWDKQQRATHTHELKNYKITEEKEREKKTHDRIYNVTHIGPHENVGLSMVKPFPLFT